MADPIQHAIAESVKNRGLRRTAELLEISQESTLRLHGGLPVRHGTAALARINIARLARDNSAPDAGNAGVR
jgi:hypothetical protein